MNPGPAPFGLVNPSTYTIPIIPIAPQGVVGDTAQTSGFANAGSPPSIAGFGGGGGLGSSPNVPKPGTSIDPATGKPHTAGMTRAELEAKKYGLTGTGKGKEKDESEVSGREQAARQLGQSGPVGNLKLSERLGADRGISGQEVITPGLELPGGWGSTEPTILPGTGPNAPTTIYEDVGEGLRKVGTAAFNVIPSGLKDAFSNQPGTQNAAQTTSARNSLDSRPVIPAKVVEQLPGENRPNVGSAKASPNLSSTKATSTTTEAPASPAFRVTALLDQARLQGSRILSDVQGQGSKIVHDIQETVATSRSGSVSASSGPGVFGQVKEFISEMATAASSVGDSQLHQATGISADASKRSSVHSAGVSGLSAPKTSLPSDEPVGALPGENSSGAGALPGMNNETGVAVLPDEKRVAKEEMNQGSLPGEVAAGSLAEVPEPDTTESTAAFASPDAGTEEKFTAAPTGIEAIESEPVDLAPLDFQEPITSVVGSTTAGFAQEPTQNARETLESQSVPETTQTETNQQYMSTPQTNRAVPTFSKSSPYELGGLAAALPATFLGTGAAYGATDVKTTGLVATDAVPPPSTTVDGISSDSALDSTARDTSSVNESTAPSTFPAASTTLSPKSAEPTRLAADRTTSMASVTAIRHGSEGSRDHYPDVGMKAATLASIGKPTEAGISEANSLTPGEESEGVGHPSTRGMPGTTREPEVYPEVDHSNTAERDVIPPTSELAATNESLVQNTPNQATQPTGPGLQAAPATATGPAHTSTTSTVPTTPVSAEKTVGHGLGHGHGSGSEHNRTASSGSGKKIGFMAKLKEKVKNI